METPPKTGHPPLTRLTMAGVASLLTSAGAKTMTPERIQADLAAGAPHNPDGTLNLLAYGAWLLHALALKEGGHDQ